MVELKGVSWGEMAAAGGRAGIVKGLIVSGLNTHGGL
jgi:hypothetical protein